MVRRRRRITMGRHRGMLVTALLMALAVLVGCSSTVGGTGVVATSGSVPTGGITTAPRSSASAGSSTGGSPTAQSPAAAPAGLETFYSQQLSWGPCASYAVSADQQERYKSASLQCARLTVPLSYDDPTGPTITIAVLRKVATDRSARIGSAVFDPGGPGVSGMDTVATLNVTSEKPTDAEKVTNASVAELNQSFDLVGLDPRGVGASRPAVGCQTDAEWDTFRATARRTRSQAEVDAANAELKTIAEKCVSRTGADEGIDGKTFLANIGTRDVAKDLDVLRAVLGDDKLTYVGFSYGTSIGTVYAEQFPQNVRAMVLDGAIDPNQDPLASSLGQAKGFQSAFDDFAAWCVKQSECVLGTDAGTATQAYQSLIRPLLETPLPLKDGRVLSFSDANTGVIQALYYQELWPTLATALQKLSGGDGGIVMFLADFYYERDQTGHYSPALQAFNAVRCVDGPTETDPAVVTKHNADYAAAAPFQDSGDPPGAVQDICAFWPVPPTMQPHVANAPGLPQVLVISTTGDPATPYQQGVDLAKELNAVLLTVEGTSHTAYLGAGNSCVDDIVNKYLITLELPDQGTTCQ